MIRDYQAIQKSWFVKGQQKVLETYGKHEGVKLLGVLDYETGKVYMEDHESYDAQVFLSFLGNVLKKYPTGNIVMILDNAKIHHAKLLTSFLQENSRLHLEFLPPYSPDLNIIEELWGWLKCSVINNVFFVTGLRRSGKSYLLFHLFNDYLKEQGIHDDHIIKIDLEDRRNAPLRDPDALLAHIDSKMVDNDMYYILLDEVQHVPEFEDVLNSYLKIDNADVYVTGSNSRFLSTDIITEFRGRGDQIHVYPLSFAEFMSVDNRHPIVAFYYYFSYVVLRVFL